jgi:nucleoside-diphosphate-sugar epimerase
MVRVLSERNDAQLMKALVTGGTGFIGFHLVQKLITEGWEIKALVRQPHRLIKSDIPKWVEVEGDLLNVSSLFSAVKDVDYVFHLAGLTHATTREKYFQVNSTGTKNLVNACRARAKKLKRFVHISSLAAMGPNADRTPLVESDPARPITWYGESKLSGENFVREMGNQVPFNIIRPPIVFGPREKGIFKIFKLINLGIQPILGSGNRYSLIYVEDLVQGIVEIARKPQVENEIFFLTIENPSGWEELGKLAAKYLKKKPLPISISPRFASVLAYTFGLFSFFNGGSVLNHQKVLEIKQKYWVCSGLKAKQILKWEPEHSLELGVDKTIQWYKTNGWL